MPDLAKMYIKRKAEFRKKFLISRFLPKCSRVLDLGCGNGEYFPYLKKKAEFVVGLDIDPELCIISKEKGYAVVRASAEILPFKDKSFDGVWASEIVEHFSGLHIINEIERITTSTILITMPNPIFPHYKEDPTHLLKYSIESIRNFFTKRSKNGWNYFIRGLGFEEKMPTEAFKKMTMYATWFFPKFAPTVAIIGYDQKRKIPKGKIFFKIIAYSIIESGTLAGGYRIVIELIKRWSRKNYNVHIYTTQEGEKMIKRYILNGNVKYHIVRLPSNIGNLAFRYPIISAILYVGLTLIGSIKLLRSVEKNNSNLNLVCYSATPFLPDIIPGFLTKLKVKNIKWLVAHSMFAPNPFKGGFRGGMKSKLPEFRDIVFYLNEKLTYPIFRKYADLFYETNELDRERAINDGAPPEKVFVIRGGVDTKQPELVPEPKEKEYDGVFIGRLHPQKGPLELIDIWKYVCKEKKDAKLAIIGNGPLEEDVKRKIKKYDMEKNIHMYGFLDGVKKIEVFRNSKVVLHPALYDSGGMAACEAMICGLPGVSFDLPVLRVYYPKGMLKTPCYDLEAFAQNILKLLEDRELYKQTQKDALDWAKEWDWDKVASDVLGKILENLEKSEKGGNEEY